MCIDDHHKGNFAMPLRGLTLLIVEPNALVALDSQDALMDAGAKSVVISNSFEEGIELLVAAGTLHATIVDIDLGRPSGIAQAQRLVAMGVPFSFASSYSPVGLLPDNLINVPFVSKPYLATSLIEALVVALQKGAPSEEAI